MIGPLIALSGIDGCGKTTAGGAAARMASQRHPGARQVKLRLTALEGVVALSETL